MRIGLLGGTFDPVHHGHLVVAERALAGFELDQVFWIPAGDPPHKQGSPITPQEHRYAMTLLATASHPRFQVTRLEMDRRGPSYSLETVLHFRRLEPEGELFFITGADAILELLTWHRPEEIVRHCRFIAAGRPGFDLGRISSALPPDYLDRIDLLETPGIDISASDIRARVRAGRTIRYLVPEPVEVYIGKQNLYRDP